jgi:hypothetical protein
MNLPFFPPPRRRGSDTHILLVAALTFMLVLGFYFYTLQPSLAWGDGMKVQLETITGESFIQSVLPNDLFADDSFPFAKVGVAAWDHPLYVIIGHTLVQLAPNIHAPWLVNTISAVFGAATIIVLFLLCFAHTQSYPASLLAALSVAVSHTFWFHSVTAEVYTLYAFLLLLSLYLFDRFERTGRFNVLIGSVFVLGLGLSNHLMTILVIPASLIYLTLTKGTGSNKKLSPGKILILGLAFFAGFSPYLIQFARMLRVFTISEAMGPVVGAVFLQELLATTPRIFLNSLLTYLMFLAYQFNPVLLVIGGYGFLRTQRVSGSLWLKLLSFYLVYTVFGIFYRVSDQFAFFLISHVFFGISIALGLNDLISKFSPPWRKGLYAGFGLLILTMPLLYSQLPMFAKNIGITDQSLGIPQIGTDTRYGLAYYMDPNKRVDTEAYLFGQEFFLRAPRDALVIAEWYTDTDEYFVLQYFSTVESLRPDIEIVGWPMEDPFNFNTNLAVRLVEEEVQNRPVYLASLSEEFYNAGFLMTRYCIVPELNFYRVYPNRSNAQIVREDACQTGS